MISMQDGEREGYLQFLVMVQKIEPYESLTSFFPQNIDGLCAGAILLL